MLTTDLRPSGRENTLALKMFNWWYTSEPFLIYFVLKKHILVLTINWGNDKQKALKVNEVHR